MVARGGIEPPTRGFSVLAYPAATRPRYLAIFDFVMKTDSGFSIQAYPVATRPRYLAPIWPRRGSGVLDPARVPGVNIRQLSPLRLLRRIRSQGHGRLPHG